MSTFDPSIILQGRQFDPVGALNFGAEAAFRGNEMEQQNALRQFLAQNGAGVMSGDEAAMAGFARFDPIAAADLMRQRELQARDAQRFEMEQARFARDMAPEEPDEAAFMEGVLRGALVEYQRGDKKSVAAWFAQNGIDPAAIPYEMVPTLAAQFGVADPGDFAPAASPGPQSAIAKLEADFRAGLISPEQYQLGMQNMAQPGMDISVTPEGGINVRQGVGVGSREDRAAMAQEAQTVSTSDVIVNSALRAYEAASERLLGGGFGALASFNPGSTNAELYRQVEVLRANAAVSNINAMRAASPTGGALGNASDADIRLLQAKSGALDPASPNFQRDLSDYTLTLLRVVHGVDVGERIFREQYLATVNPEAAQGFQPAAAAPEVNANGPAFTGQITPQAVMEMTPMQYQEFKSTVDISTLPLEIIDAMLARPE
jgi:hypothetical protein